jgi:hypothetical protein
MATKRLGEAIRNDLRVKTPLPPGGRAPELDA